MTLSLARSDVPAADAEEWQDLGILQRRGVRGWFRRHPGWMTAVVVATYAIAALPWLPVAFADMGYPAWYLVAVQTLIAVALCFRGSWPVLLTLAITVLEACALVVYPWHSVQLLGLCFALYSLGRARGPRIALPLALLTSSTAYTRFIWLDQWNQHYGSSQMWEIAPDIGPAVLAAVVAVTMVFFAVISAGVGCSVRSSRQHEAEILEWARKTRELAQVAERNRIAREMHDVVAHSLSVMISLADGARIVASKDAARAEAVLKDLSATGRTALADMRRVIGVLRQGDGIDEAQRPLRQSLDELYDGFRQAGLPLIVTTTGPPLPDDPAFGLTVHRIVQESLTNVLRYGRQVTEVEVRIEHRQGVSVAEQEEFREQGLDAAAQRALGYSAEGQVVLTISDNGSYAGEDERRPSVGAGQGIRGMAERAAFYGGSVYAGAEHGGGWTVRAVLVPPAPSQPHAAAD